MCWRWWKHERAGKGTRGLNVGGFEARGRARHCEEGQKVRGQEGAGTSGSGARRSKKSRAGGVWRADAAVSAYLRAGE